MGRLTVGNHYKAVDVDATGTLHGKHGVGPLPRFHSVGGIDPKLLGAVALPRALATFAETNEHGAASLWLEQPHVDVLRLWSEFESVAEVEAQSVGVGAIARPLKGDDALLHPNVALELSGQEGRVFPRIVYPDAAPRQAVGRQCDCATQAHEQE